jgi:hypothetical protein
MLDLCLKLGEHLNSSVFVLLAVLLVVMFLVYRAGCLSMLFSQHKEKLDRFESLNDKMVEVKTKVDLIYQHTNPRPLVASASPIAITPHGLEISKSVGADAIFARYADRLCAMVEKSSPANAYDIQVTSMDVARDHLMDMLDANEVNTIKNEAFLKGLLVEDILGIFGVLLRDRILADKGIPVAEVDKHATTAV